MISLSNITPVILTRNEEANLERTLEALSWAERIVVVDSKSTDRTVEIAQRFPQVEVFEREFDSHAGQWNYAISQVRTVWALTLDADYLVGEDLIGEIRDLEPKEGVVAFEIPFRYCVGGKSLRGSLLPPRRALFQPVNCHYFDDGHTQRLQVDGAVQSLSTSLLHNDRKPFAIWLKNQFRYARLERDKLLNTRYGDLPAPDRIRRWIVVAPVLAPLYALFWRGCILDGWRGLLYAGQRCIAELILSFELINRMFFSSEK